MSSTQQRKKPAQNKKKDNSGTYGCLFVIVLTAVFVVGPILWGMYDEGVFDGSSKSSETAPVFGGRESGLLAEQLAEASKVQNVCYGWEIDSGRSFVRPAAPVYSGTFTPAPVPSTDSFDDPSSDGVELGSNLGVGVDPRKVPDRCPRWVVFTADYYYSSIDKEWTSVSSGIKTNLDITLTGFDLDDLGITNQELLGDNANGRLADAIGALPMIVAEKGGAQPVPAPAAAQPPPAGDEVSGPGVGRYIFMGIAILLIAGGLVWIIAAAVRSRGSES
ncbi:hypothetical protein DPM19_16055 [Actinomadura craniellae]|uniref:Uncharacterized protein n=1 Tax=Actinomadura craniellae TaxID=2231787 RepID=A0A365H5U2_9ACTN|nr:hypothetical protein [Actinomadura craniellae]RAY14465.1 hypothetical protein DPM19_16055 [Actinomadura craniellae]